ncbi:hypothetical protein CSB20_05485 [bacterium DOLZORAL124_64_63]|nr:MAG: hypothetical protein CSB20_05485 [bacterium DOLZORAL124_64_63]
MRRGSRRFPAPSRTVTMSHDDAPLGGAANSLFPRRGLRAVVLCSGPPPEDELLRYWLTGSDFFVATDSAGHPYDHLPIPPDVVIGDFDSLSGRVLVGRSGPRFLQVDDQYTTDSEKALLFLVEQGIEEVIFLGATGWRVDHTLYNLQLLEQFADRLRICVAGPNARFPLLGDRLGPGGPALISNQVLQAPLLISVGQGSLLVSVDRYVPPMSLEDLGE